jgi:hypothetical protein
MSGRSVINRAWRRAFRSMTSTAVAIRSGRVVFLRREMSPLQAVSSSSAVA